jgi:hypothetical protein
MKVIFLSELEKSKLSLVVMVFLGFFVFYFSCNDFLSFVPIFFFKTQKSYAIFYFICTSLVALNCL